MRGYHTIVLVGVLCLLLAGCSGSNQVVLKQRTTAALPGLGGAVTVRIDDIKRGQTADIQILGPDSEVLASKQAAQVGDRIPFAYQGKQYEVEVVHYRDRTFHEDEATLRLLTLPED
ncbi:MAG: hypothetical protein EXR98_04340 [Gemmataceae bacterium]|nr:hypothetical protein [Gemmataceae bacterium]